MDSCLFVGVKLEKQTVDNLGTFVSKVFEAGSKCHMEQSTIVTALGLIERISSPSNISISGCTIVGEKTVHVDTKG